MLVRVAAALPQCVLLDLPAVSFHPPQIQLNYPFHILLLYRLHILLLYRLHIRPYLRLNDQLLLRQLHRLLLRLPPQEDRPVVLRFIQALVRHESLAINQLPDLQTTHQDSLPLGQVISRLADPLHVLRGSPPQNPHLNQREGLHLLLLDLPLVNLHDTQLINQLQLHHLSHPYCLPDHPPLGLPLVLLMLRVIPRQLFHHLFRAVSRLLDHLHLQPHNPP